MPKNENICCNVNECKHHSLEGDFCSLKRIQVVKHSTPANTTESTDCGNFEC